LESREQDKETLSEEETKKRNVRWFIVGNEGDIYIREGAVLL
jgi:hypothetical protein